MFYYQIWNVTDLAAWQKRKKEELLLCHMTKSLITTEMSKGQHDNTKTFDYTAIVERPRTVRWSKVCEFVLYITCNDISVSLCFRSHATIFQSYV